ncbi:MAG: thioredoxin domain-containing protein [Nitrosopumilus sp.]
MSRSSDEYNGKVDFVKINVDQNSETCTKYDVFSIQMLTMFKNGKYYYIK